MIDNYRHDDRVIYTEENLPGHCQPNAEYEHLQTEFNSQLTAHCECRYVCDKAACACLEKLKQREENYISSRDSNGVLTYILNEKLLSKDYMEPIIECNKLCPCPKDCGNRVVQYGPLDCLYVRICDVEAKGKGLFTKQLINKGTFICEYAGEVLTKTEVNMRHQLNAFSKYMNYIFCLNEHCDGEVTQTIIDPSYIGNIGRYVNHSCQPNSMVIPVRVDTPIPRLAIFSCISISPDTEITIDYGPHHHISNKYSRKKKCLCQSSNCKGSMPFDDYY